MVDEQDKLVSNTKTCLDEISSITLSQISQSQVWGPIPTSISISMKGGADFQRYSIYEQGSNFKMRDMSISVLKP